MYAYVLHACVRACVRVIVYACVRVCARARSCVCAYAGAGEVGGGAVLQKHAFYTPTDGEGRGSNSAGD